MESRRPMLLLLLLLAPPLAVRPAGAVCVEDQVVAAARCLSRVQAGILSARGDPPPDQQQVATLVFPDVVRLFNYFSAPLSEKPEFLGKAETHVMWASMRWQDGD